MQEYLEEGRGHIIQSVHHTTKLPFWSKTPLIDHILQEDSNVLPIVRSLLLRPSSFNLNLNAKTTHVRKRVRTSLMRRRVGASFLGKQRASFDVIFVLFLDAKCS